MNGSAVPVVVAGGFLKSFVEGLLAAVLVYLVSRPGITNWDVSLFVGAGSVAHISISLASGFLVRRIGMRRMMVFASTLPFVAVFLYVLPGLRISSLVAGNVVKGMALGVVTAVSPLLIAEHVKPGSRGRGAAYFQLSMQLGSVLGALAGTCVAWLSGDSPERAMTADFLLMMLPGALCLVLALRLSSEERPRLPSHVAFGLAEVRRHVRPIALAIAFMTLMSATGVGVVMNYSVVILDRMGFAGVRANASDTILRMAVIVSVLVVSRCADRWSRFHLMRTSVALMAVGFVGAAFSAGLAFVAWLILSVVAFAVGFGVCAWVSVPMLLPAAVRSQGVSVALFFSQVTTCAMIAFFPQVWAAFGTRLCLLAFAAVSALAFALFGRMRNRL